MSSFNLFGDAKATARAGDARRKQTAYDKALTRHQQSPTPETQAALATALFDLGKLPEAERLLSDLLQHFGDNVQVLCDLAFLYKNMGRTDEARRAFVRVVELDPKHALARCAENELFQMDPSYKPSWMRK
jgi:Flp pilus assembly protein TadD